MTTNSPITPNRSPKTGGPPDLLRDVHGESQGLLRRDKKRPIFHYTFISTNCSGPKRKHGVPTVLDPKGWILTFTTQGEGWRQDPFVPTDRVLDWRVTRGTWLWCAPSSDAAETGGLGRRGPPETQGRRRESPETSLQWESHVGWDWGYSYRVEGRRDNQGEWTGLKQGRGTVQREDCVVHSPSTHETSTKQRQRSGGTPVLGNWQNNQTRSYIMLVGRTGEDSSPTSYLWTTTYPPTCQALQGPNGSLTVSILNSVRDLWSLDHEEGNKGTVKRTCPSSPRKRRLTRVLGQHGCFLG